MLTPAHILDYFLTPPSVSWLHPESLSNFFRFYIHIGSVTPCIFSVTVCISSLTLSSFLFEQMTVSKAFLLLVLRSVATHYIRLHAAASEIFLNCSSNQMYPLLQNHSFVPLWHLILSSVVIDQESIEEMTTSNFHSIIIHVIPDILYSSHS